MVTLLMFKVKPNTNYMLLGMHTFTRVHMYTCSLNCEVNVYKFKRNM